MSVPVIDFLEPVDVGDGDARWTMASDSEHERVVCRGTVVQPGERIVCRVVTSGG